MKRAKSMLERRLSGTFVDPLQLKQARAHSAPCRPGSYTAAALPELPSKCTQGNADGKPKASYLADASKAWSAPSAVPEATVKIQPGERTFSHEELKGRATFAVTQHTHTNAR